MGGKGRFLTLAILLFGYAPALAATKTDVAIATSRFQGVSETAASASCISFDSDRPYADKNCNATKEAGEDYLDFTGGGGGAPDTATYITQTADGTLSAEQALSSLASGIMRVSNSTGVITSLTDSSGIASNVSDETGSGALVFASTPTLVTPVLGVATATSINKVAITAPATSATLTIANGKTLTVSNTLTFSGTDASSVAFGTGGTVAYTANNLSVFASTSSAQLAGVLSDETGTAGKVVFDTSPVLVTPTIGAATATSIAIGANTLDTNEWANLDGQDQAVKVASAVQFASLQIDSNTTGVNLDTDGDGMLIMAGTGNGNDEDLRWNFDDGSGGANTVEVTSGTGVTSIAFTSIGITGSLSSTTTAAGLTEAAIASEVDTGTDTQRAVTPDALAGSNLGEKVVQMVVFDFATNTATGDGKFYFVVPSSLDGMNLVEVHAQVITAGTTNTTNIDLARCAAVTTGNACSGTVSDMLSTNLTIDSTEDSSDTAATAAVIDAANDDVATNQIVRVDVDAVHTTAAKGLIVTLIFRLP